MKKSVLAATALSMLLDGLRVSKSRPCPGSPTSEPSEKILPYTFGIHRVCIWREQQ
jgi:hypothetical protein